MPARLQVAIGTLTTPTGVAPQTSTVNTTDQDGVAFTPKALLLFINRQTAFGSFGAHAILGHGMATSTSNQFATCATMKDAVNLNVSLRRNTASHCLILLDESGTVKIVADLNANFSTTNFVLNFTTTDTSNAYKIQYMALGGSAITNQIVTNFQSGTSAGEVAITGTGFQPNCVLFMSAPHTALDANAPNASMMFGFQGQTGTGNTGVVSMVGADAVAPTNSGRFLRNDYSIQFMSFKGVTPIPTNVGLAYVASYDSDGFTLGWGTAPTGNFYVGYLALTIEGVKASKHSSPTSPGTQNGPALTFTPRLAIFVSHGAAYEPVGIGPKDHASYAIGFMSTSSARGYLWMGEKDNVNPSEADQLIKNDNAIGMANYGSPTINEEADFSAMGTTWTLNFTTADGGNYDYMALTLGEHLPFRESLQINQTVNRASTY